VPVVPARLLDTRPGLGTVDGQFSGMGIVPAGGVVSLTVDGRGGVAADASAVALNVTVANPSAAGFVTVYPCGGGIPNSSSVNFAAGATVANAVVSQVGAGGGVCAYSNVATSLIVDVNGYFPAGSTYEPVVPGRFLDTRTGMPTIDGQFAGGGSVPAGGVVPLNVAGRGAVAMDAAAVVTNVTVVHPEAAGFVTVFPCGSPVPNSSSLNFTAGATVANAVIAKVGVGGAVCLYSNVATDLVVDVTGWFPGSADFTSLAPARLLDTRPGMSTADGFYAGSGQVQAGSVIALTVAGRAGVGADAEAVVLNVTVVNPSAAGFVTVYPCGGGIPNSSSVNFAAGSTVPNAVVAQVGAAGQVCLYSNVSTHVLADVNGYFPATA
jgi:hypothetical protein